MKALRMRVAEWWCTWMHDGAMWPVHGRYRCRQCRRLFAVPWEAV